MWKQARFYSSKIGGLGAALLAAVTTLLVWNLSMDDSPVLLPHYSSLMNLMLIIVASIAVMSVALITAHRIVIERRMRALGQRPL